MTEISETESPIIIKAENIEELQRMIGNLIDQQNKSPAEAGSKIKVDPEEQYEKIHPCILRMVCSRWTGGGKRVDTIDLHDLPNLDFYFASETWINERVKCLMNALLKMSYKAKLETGTIQRVADAFSKLVKSFHYKRIQDDYSHKKVVEYFAEKLQAMFAHVKESGSDARLYLSLEKRADIIAVLYSIGGSAPAKKLHELDFEG